MNDTQTKLCPVERAGALDLSLRKVAHYPTKILKPYIKTGMTVLDVGCGPKDLLGRIDIHPET